MESDKFYHLFNRTNNKELLFKEEENYFFFLDRVKIYIIPIADIYAYCLLPNHFHFVLKVKEEKVLKIFFKKKIEKLLSKPSGGGKPLEGYRLSEDFKSKKKKDLQGFQNLEGLMSKLVIQQFSNFFNSYTKSINKTYHRKGSLFTPRFKRKAINSEEYLKQVIQYVHLNPNYHDLGIDFKYYKHSSYKAILSQKPTILKRAEVLELFDDLENFKYVHQCKQFNEEIVKAVLEEDD